MSPRSIFTHDGIILDYIALFGTGYAGTVFG